METTISIKLPKYRTIKECVCEIKRLDSETAISEWFVRQLCKTNKVIYYLSGNKSIVNLDDLLMYLQISQ